MAIAGHVSRSMIEHYSHIRMEAKRMATDAIVEGGVHQNVHQVPESNSSTVPKSLIDWWAWVDLNHRPRPYQSGLIWFYNNLQDRGDCQNTRKSYKTSYVVGWIVGWKKSMNSVAIHILISWRFARP